MHFVLVGINMGSQYDMMPLVAFHCIWVHNGPALAVLVANKHLAVVADLTFDVHCFLGSVSLHAVIVHRVLCRSHSHVQEGQCKTNRHQCFHIVLHASFEDLTHCVSIDLSGVSGTAMITVYSPLQTPRVLQGVRAALLLHDSDS